MPENRDVGAAIKGWLFEQGYPLEMRVASQFRNAGFEVRQADFYSDPETGTQREIDVFAHTGDSVGGMDVTFHIECKRSTDKPWLLFSSPHPPAFNRLLGYAVTSESTRHVVVEKDIRAFMELPWAKKDKMLGYGLTQAFTTGEDIAFRASTGALKSAIAERQRSERQSWQPFLFAFPVIVIDGMLFECTLDGNDELLVTQRDHGELFLQLSLAGESATCVHIVTSEHLEHFAIEAFNVAKTLVEFLSEESMAKVKAV
jgi:hypothetical protein